MKILVVEDEKELNQMIRDYLKNLGWETIGAENGPDALKIFRAETPEFILLDVMIPGLDGMDVIRRIRQSSKVPIIFITAMAEESDKLMGLELGADDYITKPFSLREMSARIRAVLRRIEEPPEESEGEVSSLSVGDLVLDAEKRRVFRNGESVQLTTVQFEILKGFMRHPGRVFSRVEILGFFQEDAYEGYERTIDVHIKNIRKILEPDRMTPRYLHTVRGVGYRLEDGLES